MCGHGHHAERKKERLFLKRDNTVILVIDIQDKLSKAMFNEEQIKKNAKVLLELSNLYDIPVIFTEQNPNSLGTTNEELINIPKNKSVYPKMDFSGFGEIQGELEKIGRKNIIVIGIETHICVYQTVRDLVLNGYNPTVLFDSCSSREKKNHKNALKLMDKMHTTIASIETVLFDIVSTAKDENFKSAQKLII